MKAMLLDFNLDLDNSCAITIEIENLIVRKTIFASVYFVVTTCNSCTTEFQDLNIEYVIFYRNCTNEQLKSQYFCPPTRSWHQAPEPVRCQARSD